VNLHYLLADNIAKGERWLEQQHEAGCYFANEHDRGIQPTAAAAHYWAWAAAIKVGKDRGYLNHARAAADWMAGYWEENERRLPDPGSGTEYFFDLGCAARALFAVYRATEVERYADVSVQMVARMSDFANATYPGRFHAVIELPGAVTYIDPDAPPIPNGHPAWRQTFGPHQRKAAVALRLFNRPLYDVVDVALMDYAVYFTAETGVDPDLPLAAAYEQEDPAKRQKPTGKVAKEIAEFTRRCAIRSAEHDAVRCQIEAYSAEALVLGQYSQQRARQVIEQLGVLIAQSPILRTDAYGQWIRLRLLTGAKPSFPLIDIEKLCQAQTPSGGWQTFMAHPDPATCIECSVEATVIAMQTLGIYADRSDRTAFPHGPLGKRELVII
jgi:hypothetical protein